MSPVSPVFHTVESMLIQNISRYSVQSLKCPYKASQLFSFISPLRKAKLTFTRMLLCFKKPVRSSTLNSQTLTWENKSFNYLKSFIWAQSKYYKGRNNDLKCNLIQQKWRAEIGMLKVLLITWTFLYITNLNIYLARGPFQKS